MNFQHNVNNLGMFAQQQQQMNRVKICIRNANGASLQDLLNFISRNARISLADARNEGNMVTGFVNNKIEAQSLMKWNGAQFAGNGLKIEILNDSSSPGTSNTIILLKNFLYKRYDPANKMLNLASLHNDPDLIQNGLFSSISTQSKMFPALMKVASSEPQLVVESINLADNNLKDITGITTLAQTFPNLKNLCLANNQIMKVRTLEVWKNKFKELSELLMTNNPITNDSTYKKDMLRLFPKLVMLDNVVVRDAQKLNSIYSLPMKVQQFFFETNEVGQSSTDFVMNFLNCWDTDRNQLLPLYTPQSQFSMAVDSSIAPSTVEGSDQNPSLGYYLSSSRNIVKVSSEKSIDQRLFMGPEAISNAFKHLPMTKHHLQDEPNEYSVQALSLPQVNGFLITLHGYFEETGKPEISSSSNQGKNARNRRLNNSSVSSSNRLSKKSFERVWVIVPMGSSVVIASDLLTIRPYTSNSWYEPPQPTPASQPQILVNTQQQQPVMNQGMGGMPGQQPQTMGGMSGQQPQMGNVVLAPTLQLPPDVQNRLNTVQLELLNKLHLETKLNAEYTYMLAEGSQWNYDMALKGFQNSISNIPRDAYIQ